MKINFNQILNFSYPKFQTAFKAQKLQFSEGFDSFEYDEEIDENNRIQNSIRRQRLLSPITSQDEYNNAIDEIFNYNYQVAGFEKYFLDDTGYENIDPNLKGLIPYCGLCDRSYTINAWLSGRPCGYFKDMEDYKIARIIDALDYSLEKLDEKYGKFEGKVFRKGFFNPNSDNQFYSASDKINCTAGFHSYSFEGDKTFSIIKVKNGHKINAFQKDVNSHVSSDFAKKESEILIDRKSRFRKVPFEEYSKDDFKDIKEILKRTYKLKPWQLNLDKLNKKYDIFNFITIWEEV